MAMATVTTRKAKAHPKVNTKTGRAPTKVQREQAANRREATRDGLPKAEARLGDFAERFCIEYVRIGIPEDAHRAAELALGVPLDTSGYDVQEEITERTVKGQLTRHRSYIITDRNGHPVSEYELRSSSAANLLVLPEVAQRIRDLRHEAAKLVKITAESLALEFLQIKGHAIRDKQYQVAANCVAASAKMFGLDALGQGAGGAEPPAAAASVNINIRNFTGKAAARED